MNFEERLQKIETITKKLQDEHTSLEDSIALLKKATLQKSESKRWKKQKEKWNKWSGRS